MDRNNRMKIEEILDERGLIDVEKGELFYKATENESFMEQLLSDDFHIENSDGDMFDWLYDEKYAIYEYARNTVIKQADVGKCLVEIEISGDDRITELSTGKCVFVYE